MSADERLNNNIDDDEKAIEELLLKLQVMGFYEDKYTKLKEKYLALQSKYYGERLKAATEGEINLQTGAVNKKARYAVDMETDVLKPLEELIVFANCRHYIKVLTENESISIDDVVDLLEEYTKIPKKSDKKNDLFNEIGELFDEIGELLYKLIKKDAELNNRYEIIDILFEYLDDGYNYLRKVTRLFLEEVNEIFQNNKSIDVINLVKHATNSEFDKEDIINLLIATGKKPKEEKVEEKKDTKKFDESKSYTIIPYTRRIIVAKNVIFDDKFSRLTQVNPFPKTKEENMKLREYDLTRVRYIPKNKRGKTIAPNYENCDMSYTNVIIDPHFDKSIIRGANLEGVDMRGVDLTDVDITGTNLINTGANIVGSIGECLGVSAYQDERMMVSRNTITPMQFEELTKENAFPNLFSSGSDFYNECPSQNRILRQYDLSCVDYSFEYIWKVCLKRTGHFQYSNGDGINGRYFSGLDFSYTNININPQQFTSALHLNLEGVDLRDKDFTGVEEYFVNCNLKGTGANISPKINPTVSEYIVSSRRKGH